MANYSGKYTPSRSTGINKKPIIAVLAVILALATIFGGTFAWQSISQTALNEVTGIVNPGGRLHDDFVDITYNDDGSPAYKTMTYNKDVYVENFTSLASNGVQIFARVRLDEYMEIGKNAGQAENNEAVSLVPGATLDDKSTWYTHVYKQPDIFDQYWTWTQEGGSTIYMPTFNKNKDSLEADINGTFREQFTDYTKYHENDTREARAIYDADTAPNGNKEIDELAKFNVSAKSVIDGTIKLPEGWDAYITLIDETHTAKKTNEALILTMAQYLDRLNNDIPTDDTGDFWVYDTDGWAYWAKPIDPDSATGLLLDGIQRKETIINADWYYAINVVAQFITGDDLGQDDQTGFYDISEGHPPSEDALLLLNAIGVDVTFEVQGDETTSAEAALIAALKHGGNIKLMEDVEISDTLNITKDTVLDLNGFTIYNTQQIWPKPDEGPATAADKALIYVSGEGVTLTINGGDLLPKDNDCYAISVNDGAKVIINGGTIKGNISSVYVESGEAIINGGTFFIMQEDVSKENHYARTLDCHNENYRSGTAKITVTGGSFYDIDPQFSDDGNLVPNGYTVESTPANNTTIIYNVTKTSAQPTPNE